MMNTIEMHQLLLTVHFDGETIVLSGDITDNQIIVHQGLCQVIFQLEPTRNAPTAIFPMVPFQSAEGGRSRAYFHGYKNNDQRATVVVSNSDAERTTHPFFVLVQYDNQIYSKDPSIVNLPPTGGPGEGA